jgi:hypothetical protein
VALRPAREHHVDLLVRERQLIEQLPRGDERLDTLDPPVAYRICGARAGHRHLAPPSIGSVAIIVYWSFLKAWRTVGNGGLRPRWDEVRRSASGRARAEAAGKWNQGRAPS